MEEDFVQASAVKPTSTTTDKIFIYSVLEERKEIRFTSALEVRLADCISPKACVCVCVLAGSYTIHTHTWPFNRILLGVSGCLLTLL